MSPSRPLRVADIITYDLRVLFCGINPGLYSAAVGHHFARPGNRFWKTLFGSGFTPVLLSPSDERQLLELGLGITNLVSRATASADELSAGELRRGAERLEAKLRRFRPGAVAFLGLQAYRQAFARPKATVGLQPDTLAGTPVWLLPNPSGLQAHYQLPELVEAFTALRQATSCPFPST